MKKGYGSPNPFIPDNFKGLNEIASPVQFVCCAAFSFMF